MFIYANSDNNLFFLFTLVSSFIPRSLSRHLNHQLNIGIIKALLDGTNLVLVILTGTYMYVCMYLIPINLYSYTYMLIDALCTYACNIAILSVIKFRNGNDN